MKQGNLVWRLLRRNISAAQLAGYAVANLIGLSIVLTAMQFYRDTTAEANRADDAFLRRDYLIISKQVSEAGALFGATTTFSEAERADLEAQPWVKDMGLFTPSRYHVTGAVELGGRGMSTYLFFESIPDKFFDILPSGWKFDPSNPRAEIPIVISKDYLALYNFGFAASRGMPQFSESLITTIPLTIRLSGNGRHDVYPARVVGFSSRLNTIAVPDEFMQWANAEYGDEDEPHDPSRVILEVSDPGNPAIERYFHNHNIEVAGDKADSGKAAYFLSIMSMVVIVIGVVISLLAFFILMLSIYLLLQKSREKLHDLMMLGYTPAQTASRYYQLVAAINGAITVLSVAVMLVARNLWREPFANLGLSTSSPMVTILAAIVIMAAITLINILAIRRIVNRNF